VVGNLLGCIIGSSTAGIHSQQVISEEPAFKVLMTTSSENI